MFEFLVLMLVATVAITAMGAMGLSVAVFGEI